MLIQREAMANSSGSEEYGIKEILIRFIAVPQAFACVKKIRTIVISH